MAEPKDVIDAEIVFGALERRMQPSAEGRNTVVRIQRALDGLLFANTTQSGRFLITSPDSIPGISTVYSIPPARDRNGGGAECTFKLAFDRNKHSKAALLPNPALVRNLEAPVREEYADLASRAEGGALQFHVEQQTYPRVYISHDMGEALDVSLNGVSIEPKRAYLLRSPSFIRVGESIFFGYKERSA